MKNFLVLWLLSVLLGGVAMFVAAAMLPNETFAIFLLITGLLAGLSAAGISLFERLKQIEEKLDELAERMETLSGEKIAQKPKEN